MRTLVLALAGAGTAVIAASAAVAQTSIRIDSWVSPRHQQNAIVLPGWAKQVEEATQGRVTAAISYPPNVNPATFFDRTVDGISDVVWGFHGYNAQRFVLTQIVELPGLDADAREASVAYWRIHEKHLKKFEEHKGVHILTVFSHGPGVLHSRQPVTSIDSFKGLKVRIGGGVSTDVANALGMVQVHAPAPKVYEILAQGVADAVLMTMEVKTSFKLAEVTPHTLVVPGGIYYGTFFTAMNPDKFNKLGRQDQEAVMRVSGEALANLTGKAWAEADDSAVGEAKAAGNTIANASPALAQAIKARLAGIERDWIERAQKKGMANAKDVLAELRAEVAKIKTEKK